MHEPQTPELQHGVTTKAHLEIVHSLLAKTTGRDVDVAAVMRMVCAHAQSVTGAGGAVVEIAAGDQMVYEVATGTLIAYEGLKIPQSGSLSGLALQSRSVELCVDSELDGWPNLAAIFVTGHADAALVREEVGSIDVEICAKPFSLPELFATIAPRENARPL